MIERTLALIKPDATQRKLAGWILTTIEDNKFKIIHIQSAYLSRDHAKWFYGKQHQDKPYFEELCAFMASGLTIALVLEADNAIQKWRDLMGPMDPAKRTPEQIRTRFQRDGARLMENLVHGSDSREAFMSECLAFGLTTHVWE